MNILSIQSWVAYGHVGNTAAIFPMQRLDHEVWAVNTVQFSNHPGYDGFRGEAVPGEMVGAVITGIAERGLLSACDAVLSGYLGNPETAAAVRDGVLAAKDANPNALYCCDPVIGDLGSGVYVKPAVAEMIDRTLLPLADVLTPNHFELQHLAAMEAESDADIARALDRLHRRGPRTILVTSVHAQNTPADMIDVIVSSERGRWRVRSPRLPLTPNGTGDVVAALFLVHLLTKGDAADAASRAVSSIHGVLRRTVELKQREIALIAAQKELVAPGVMFEAQSI